MAAANDSVLQSSETPRAKIKGWPAASLAFDLTAAFFATWFLIGLFVDGHAHNHGQVDNTFITPWHALLYSGVALMGAFLALSHFRNVNKGYAWARALPKGYMLALVGVIIFMHGGGFDFWWHNTFGFEANTEALLSPAHLLLASGAFLFITGPLRSAWIQVKDQNWLNSLPAMISILVLFSLLTFFTMYSNFFTSFESLVEKWTAGSDDLYFWNATAISYFLVQSALTMGIMLLAMRRWTFPLGGWTLILTINALLMYWLREGALFPYANILIAVPVAALLIDLLMRALEPSAERPVALRIFAFLTPTVLIGLPFAVLIVTAGVWWTIHMWLGVVFLSGLVGLFLSYLAVPPALPIEE